MSSNYMGDVSSYINSMTGTSGAAAAAASQSASNAYSLTFEDVLNLMVVQLQNQTMDDTVDTTDMLNQMIQMQVVQSITDITDATIMSYAASLVGKEVTIVTTDSKGNVSESVVTITGTGYCNGSQVVFAGDEMYSLNQIAAVGTLPKNLGSGTTAPDKVEDAGQGGDVDKVEDTDKVEDSDKVEDTDKTEDAGSSTETPGEIPDDRPVDSTGETEDTNSTTEDKDIVDPSAEAEQVT